MDHDETHAVRAVYSPANANPESERSKEMTNPIPTTSSVADSAVATLASTEQSLEAHFSHLQETVMQWWQKLKDPQPLERGTVVILGQTYCDVTVESLEVAEAVALKIWCTYRFGFEPIQRVENGPAPLSFITSMIFNSISAKALLGGFDNLVFLTDVGWGCMIRTSQSLLANTFRALGGESSETELEILKLFGDNYERPFSLHNFVKAASQLPLEVKPGEWFGPSAASLSIKRLCSKYSSNLLPLLRVHVSENSDLCDEDMAKLFEVSPDAVLVLFPVRLGIESVNLYYYPSILELFALPQSVGIAGGKPSSSYYFIGHLGNNLLYLDPHNLQLVSEDTVLYHTPRCQMLPVLLLDPLMLIGILLRDIEEYHRFKQSIVKTNKIISFHERPIKKSIAGDDYIRINAQPGMAAMDDYVDVSDQFSGENLLWHESASESDDRQLDFRDDSRDDSLDKFDMVEHPE